MLRHGLWTAFLSFTLILTAEPQNSPAPANSRASANADSQAQWKTLPLNERIAQLIVVRAYGDTQASQGPEYDRLAHWVHDLNIGGFIVAGRIRNGVAEGAKPLQMATLINRLQEQAKTPLFVASDFEHGASMRVADTAEFPFFMAYGAAHDLDAVRDLGAATAQESRALGVNWVFAPDADVNNNPANPIINTRSYGEDPKAVAEAVGAFIDGAHNNREFPIMVTVKHFPGHGDTAQDSHMGLARLDQSKQRIESMELVPFRAAIEHHVDAIMTAHMAVPAYEAKPVPATVSRKILTNLLRDELSFSGIVVTDAMDMKGITSLYSPGEGAVRAVEAGADVLLMSPDPDASISAIKAAVASGRISEERINLSVARILKAKQDLNLEKTKLVDLKEVDKQLNRAGFEIAAQKVADKAVTLVKDEQHLFPLADPAHACVLVLTENRHSRRGEALTKAVKERAPEMPVFSANSSTPQASLTKMAGDLRACQQTYVAAFVTVSAYRGGVALQKGLAGLMNTVAKQQKKVAMISLGSPYLLRDFPSVAAAAATFSTTSTSEIAAVKAIFGEIEIAGKLPVTIPGLAKLGEGLTVAARAKTESN